MTDSNSKLPTRTGGPVASTSGTGSLLDSALANLPAEQREKLIQKALEQKLDLEVEGIKANRRFDASSADMANTVDHVRRLEASTRSDYTVRASYETASGNTSVEVKKSNNTVVIVIAVVVAIVFLVFFSR